MCKVINKYLQSISKYYPNYLINTVEILNEGQNNYVFLLNNNYVFRFPKNNINKEKLKFEYNVLDILRNDVILNIPNPEFYHLGETPEESFIGYKLIEGLSMNCKILKLLNNKDNIAKQLATFLKVLHSPENTKKLMNVVESYKQTYVIWENMYNRFQRNLYKHMNQKSITQIDNVFELIFKQLDKNEIKHTLIHGDFGPTNIIVNVKKEKIMGIIDFGSTMMGDPATDVASLIGKYGYGLEFVETMTRTYNNLEHYIDRAILYAKTFPLQEALYGIETNNIQAFESGIKEYR